MQMHCSLFGHWGIVTSQKVDSLIWTNEKNNNIQLQWFIDNFESIDLIMYLNSQPTHCTPFDTSSSNNHLQMIITKIHTFTSNDK